MKPPSRFGGEARLVHVVCFLCSNGVVEQPRLIHIHHLHHSGVHLQDVKRWLSELRGKEVGESFAWSYKRRYKTGFVWQDVRDYELVTPISDNEYVLMGSELPHEHTNPLFETGEKSPKLQLETTVSTMQHLISTPETLQIDRDRDRGDIISPKPPPRQDQDSPRAAVPPITNRPESPVAPPIPLSTSSSTSDASKQMVVIKVDAWKQNGARVQAEKKRRQETEKEHSGACLGGKGGSGTCLGGRKGESGTCLGGKGGSCNAFYSGSGKKASNVFQSLLKPCRAVNTDDSVTPGVRRRERDMLAGGVAGEVCTYRRSLDGSNSKHCRPTNDGKNTRMSGERVVSAVYMPAGEPNCSQCGKSFNPEKLHSHMKSCKALRRSRKD